MKYRGSGQSVDNTFVYSADVETDGVQALIYYAGYEHIFTEENGI